MAETSNRPPAPRPESHPVVRVLWAVLTHRLTGTVFKIGLSGGILIWLVLSKRLDFSAFAGERVTLRWVLLAPLLMLPSYVFVSIRFQLILQALDLPVTFPRALQWTMIGEFFSLAMPTATGGDVVKAVYAARAYGKGNRGVAILSVLLDRVVGLFGLFCFALLACLLGGAAVRENPRLAGLTWLLALGCAAVLVIFALLTSRRVVASETRRRLVARLPLHDKLEKVYRGFAGLRRHPGKLALTLLLSLLNHACWCASLVVVARGLGLDLAPGAPAGAATRGALVVMPLALFLNTFGFAGGFGVGEAAFEFLFQALLGAERGVGTTLAFAYHLFILLVRLFGLPFYLAAGRAPQKDELAEAEQEAPG